ncbi:hypothetical protein ALC60_13959 [Trachymyrmex zeteki]|uniref:Uncharacterized protein n=1 Tax=Mycetomoellerius zeteki TaxID=64791 RepID=A0A151WGQ9_9HYME|nr:hypothetical protein ALC60_13959 [Trachymyrmex zeteki]
MQQLEIAARSHCSRSVFHANALTINPKGHAIAPDALPVMHNNRTICMNFFNTYVQHFAWILVTKNTPATPHLIDIKCNVICSIIYILFIYIYIYILYVPISSTVCEHQPRVGHERAGAERQSSSMSVVRIVSRLSLRSYQGPF